MILQIANEKSQLIANHYKERMGSNQGKPLGGSNVCWNPLNASIPAAINAALAATTVGGDAGNPSVSHVAGHWAGGSLVQVIFYTN